MPATGLNPGVYPGTRIVLTVLVLVLGGCAATAVKPAHAPDESALAPARRALAKARDAHAEAFAPRAVDAARRRITTARDILYTAARAKRALKKDERQRVSDLVAAAKLDARSALIQTQAKAVRTQIERLRGSSRGRPGRGLQTGPGGGESARGAS